MQYRQYYSKHSKNDDHIIAYSVAALIASMAVGIAIGVGASYKAIEAMRQEKYKMQEQRDLLQELLVPDYKKKTEKIGEFQCTAYCGCEKCCGHSHGITKSGTVAKANRTVAVDPKVIPLGSKLYINGQCYTAEDTGKSIKGKRIDIFFDNHAEAVEFGVQEHNVEIERVA